MKKNKSNKQRPGRPAASISLFRAVILISAIIFFVILMLFASQYIKSSEKVEQMKEVVDRQIELTSSFYPEYLKAAQSSSLTLHKHVTDFDKTILQQTAQSDEFSSEQMQAFSQVKANWKKLRLSLAQLFPSIPSREESGIFATYIVLPNNMSEVENQIKTMRDQLFDLKETYTIHIGVPFSPILSMVVAASLAVLLFTTWIVLQLRSNINLQKESYTLRLEAEKKNARDQRAINQLMDDIEGLSDGDLTVEASVSEDFTGIVAKSINFTVRNMRDMVGTIMRTSEGIGLATEDTQNISKLLKKSSEDQSEQITSANTIATSMAHSLNETAETTDGAVEIARSSVEMAQEGRSWVMSTVRSMASARENIQDTSKRIKRLGESSQEIGDIIEIIKSIAEQTNILALNAAIQATAAGEAGRGFAVVADEVQQLAERSGNATKQIEMLVKTIQADAHEAIASMESSTAKVVAGSGIAEEAGQSLDKIENVSQNLANLIINVSRSTRNAARMADEVVVGMNQLSLLNESTVSDVERSVQSIDDLKGLSISLKQSVSDFKLP